MRYRLSAAVACATLSLVIAALIPRVARAADGDWPMLAHDAGMSGATKTELRPPFERKWYRPFPDEGLNAGVQPVIADGAVYVGSLHGVDRPCCQADEYYIQKLARTLHNAGKTEG